MNSRKTHFAAMILGERKREMLKNVEHRIKLHDIYAPRVIEAGSEPHKIGIQTDKQLRSKVVQSSIKYPV